MGGALGAEFTAGVPLTTGMSGQSVTSTATLQILGVSLPALEAVMGIPATADGTSYTEFYSFGKRVFSQSETFQMNGLLGATLGLAPAEIRVPFIVYPIGPLILEVDGGVRFEADLQGQLIPTILTPVINSMVDAKFTGTASGAGFVEGYAQLVAVRGGVGGQVNLLDGEANVDAVFSFNGAAPVVAISAIAEFLNGDLYAFFDVFNIFGWSWKRLWNHTLFEWNGICYSEGALSCSNAGTLNGL